MSGQSTMKNFKKMLGEAKRPERSVPLCLRGDLVADFEQVERELEAAQKKSSDSLAGGGIAKLVDQLDALTEQMRDHTYDVRLRAMPKPEFRALVAAHPPRRAEDSSEIVERDRYVGVNSETFFDALIRACVVDPELDDAEWKTLLEETLTDKQFDALSDAAWYLNRGDVDIPFSRAASRLKQASETE
jgi:hypothetical protein